MGWEGLATNASDIEMTCALVGQDRAPGGRFRGDHEYLRRLSYICWWMSVAGTNV